MGFLSSFLLLLRLLPLALGEAVLPGGVLYYYFRHKWLYLSLVSCKIC